jgi:Divergent InlB B-repeat domain
MRTRIGRKPYLAGFVAVSMVLGALMILPSHGIAGFAGPGARLVLEPSSPHSLLRSLHTLAAPPTVAASPAATPEGFVPRIETNPIPMLHYPLAWGPDHTPPGAPIPRVPSGLTPAQFASTWSHNGSYPLVDGACFGRWSAGGQYSYSNNCYGHDEPGLNPFSNLPGSGGNVTWDVTLPVDRSPTQNQSDIYTAIWFGMDLNDPFGYDGQCFLELQLYPDTNGAYLPQDGVWSAFAVAWQIQLSNGVENPCFAKPLELTHSVHPIVFNQGDRLNVTMTGWIGSPYGENITVTDLTTGQTAFLNLFNRHLGIPLDPAYLANNIDDALPWSPGGDLPVSFAFESGHTFTGATNNSFGGCNSGVPPPTLLYPSTPCPSYDPQSWANDTLVPWHFYPPVFFNGKSRQAASQIGFIQDFGGIAWIDPLSQGSCLGRDGSAWCSYPWYSYLGTAHAFTFGATDYAGTTADYGQYRQYATALEGDSAGLGYFAVNNFTAPTDGGATLRISLNGSGTVHFLDRTIRATTTFSHLSPGSYSISAKPTAGQYFRGYTSSGLVHLDAASTAWSSFGLQGPGAVHVTFGGAPARSVAVAFHDSGGHGAVAIDPGFVIPISANLGGLPGVGSAIQISVPSTTVVNGVTLHLTPGIYSLQAYPKPGYNFIGWTSSSGEYVFAPGSNYTWVNITAGGSLTAHYSATSQLATVFLYAAPAEGGAVTFDGATYPSGSWVTVPVGSYSIQANPNASYRFDLWSTLWSGTMTNFSRVSMIQLQNGTTPVVAVFANDPTLTIATTGHGEVLLDDTPVTGSVRLPQIGQDILHAITGAPGYGYRFSGWSVSNGSALALGQALQSFTNLTVIHSGTLTATFVAALQHFAVTFRASGGSIAFGAGHVLSGTSKLGGVTDGAYPIRAVPGPGSSFAGWATTGRVAVNTVYLVNAVGEWVASYQLLAHGVGTVRATFVGTTFPVTFVDPASPTGGIATITGGSGSVTLASGASVNLAAGWYNVTVSGGHVAHARWFATSNLSVASPFQRTTSVYMGGSGSLYALAVSAPVLHSVVADPAVAPQHSTISVEVSLFGGTSPFFYSVRPAAGVPLGAVTCSGSSVLSIWNTTAVGCTGHRLGSFTLDVSVTDANGLVVSGTVVIKFVHPLALPVPSGGTGAGPGLGLRGEGRALLAGLGRSGLVGI